MKTESARIETVEAGIDWVTWITKRSGGREPEVEWAREVIEEQRQRGSVVRPFSALGYTGEGVEGCAIGWRADTTYLRISGSLAASKWCALSLFSGTPSRLDVQTTFLHTTAVPRFGKQVLAQTPTRRRPIRGRPPMRTCITNNRGSWTGSAGTRANPIYLRVYDKGIESGSHAKGFRWRIELEAKAAVARKLWDEVRVSAEPNVWFLNACERAVVHFNGHWPLERNDGLPVLPSLDPRDPADVERKLRWLKSQVAPSIEQLLPFIGTERLLQVLGLDGYAEALTAHTQTKELSWNG